MTATRTLNAKHAAVRTRVAIDAALIALPLVLVSAILAWRGGGWGAAGIGAGLVGGLLAMLARQRIRAFDRAWLVARLNARLPRLEDSAGLLFADPDALDGLAALQRRRLEDRATELDPIDLRPVWSWRRMAAAWGLSAAAIALALAWPGTGSTPADAVPAAGPGGPMATRVTGVRLRITPPAYTGLPPRETGDMDIRIPEGARVDWIISFAEPPGTAAIVLPDGGRVALVRHGRRWMGSRVVRRSELYRLEAEGLARQRLRRIDVAADAPPDVRLVSPDRQLILATPGQSQWTPVFEASDDYGVAAIATLRVTVTRGEGEAITVEQKSLTLAGRGDPRRRRYSATLDLAREGLEPGGDLIVQLVVRDNRAPQPQEMAGPSVILRRPSDLALADGLEGMMLPATAAYFASQRQIIIDAEALITEPGRTEPRAFMDRSNALGVDQARLRLRYGQFIGQKAEGLDLPTNDAPALPTNDAPAPAGPAAPEEHHHADDGHDHGPDDDALGTPMDVVRQFGHVHDDSDASTLFDPGTRDRLTLALNAMWGSERALRQGRPEDALPFANEALEHLKAVQQATRIFLPRVGANLPPVDLSRRLTGDRADIGARLAPPVETARDRTLAQAWQALQRRSDGARLEALDRWVRANRSRVGDPLGLAAAIDNARAEPDCVDCLDALRAQVWRALEPPPVQVHRRDAPSRRGQRYLDSLR